MSREFFYICIFLLIAAVDSPASNSTIAFSRNFIDSDLSLPGLGELGSDQYAYKPMDVAVTVFDAQALQADWREFSSLYSIYIVPSDWDDFSPGIRDALRIWIRFGGLVGIVDNDLHEARRVMEELAPRSDAMVGVFGNPNAVRALAPHELAQDISEFHSNSTAFAIGAPTAEFAQSGPRERNQYQSRSSGGKKQNFPLRESFGRRDIPYVIICLLLILFAVLVGPVSLRLLAGTGRRHRLFLITPLLSLATSGLLVIVMLFHDGVGIDGRRFTILDLAPADSPQSSTLVYQEQFARAGMIPGGSFPIAAGLMPILPVETAAHPLTVRDQQAVGGWIPSRRDRSITLVGTTPIRWNVTHAGATEDSLKLLVESPITRFEVAWFIDGDGLVWKWDNREADADGRLRFIAATRSAASVMRPMFERCSTMLGDAILDRVDHANQRNRFWALAKDGAAGAIATHPNIKWLESRLVITSKVTPMK